jgi:hypothetical protein
MLAKKTMNETRIAIKLTVIVPLILIILIYGVH